MQLPRLSSTVLLVLVFIMNGCSTPGRETSYSRQQISWIAGISISSELQRLPQDRQKRAEKVFPVLTEEDGSEHYRTDLSKDEVLAAARRAGLRFSESEQLVAGRFKGVIILLDKDTNYGWHMDILYDSVTGQVVGCQCQLTSDW